MPGAEVKPADTEKGDCQVCRNEWDDGGGGWDSWLRVRVHVAGCRLSCGEYTSSACCFKVSAPIAGAELDGAVKDGCRTCGNKQGYVSGN